MHYIYIDDDPKSYSKIQGFVCKDLSICSTQHQDSWERQMDFLTKEERNFDGLILDLKLDDLPNDHHIRAGFRGTSLAQEIRTRQKEGTLKSFPIVLFSANDKVQLALESLGQDLFDIFIDKSNINSDSFRLYTPRLISLAEGYISMQKTREESKTLAIDKSLLDSRFSAVFTELCNSPIHVHAKFLISELIEKQGLLIDEEVLAARLGIDMYQSKDWDQLKSNLSPMQYKGVFSGGWMRWWMPLIDKWWNDSIGADFSLRSSSATHRVKKIKESLQLEHLSVAQKIDKSNSDEFWTTCKGYSRPLDPVDGLLVQGQDNLYPWQEPIYVSIDAALKRKNKGKWVDLADIEKEYFEELKIMFRPKKP